MPDPLGLFLTWNTYGTWLPGDARGWVKYHEGWQLRDPFVTNCRTNHVHVVVAANLKPEDAAKQFKAWCTRHLKELERSRLTTAGRPQ